MAVIQNPNSSSTRDLFLSTPIRLPFRSRTCDCCLISSCISKEQGNSSSAIGTGCSINVKKKIVRSPVLDRHQREYNRLQFVQKLIDLITFEPRRFLPLRYVSKYRVYLGIPALLPVVSWIGRYPSIFQLFRLPGSRKNNLAVCLTSAATEFASEQYHLRALHSDYLAIKLHKLLMLSSRSMLLFSKLARLAPDLGLPPNFRSSLCSEYPQRFRVSNSPYGEVLELVQRDPLLAVPTAPIVVPNNEPIVVRPPKFHGLKLRKGLNLKIKHVDFLVKMREVPDANPYATVDNWPDVHTMEGEKRACGAVREMLVMTLEKTTLMDNLAVFRKDFGLPKNVRSMIIRHPDLFYVSKKGIRDSAILVEGYDDKGNLIQVDVLLKMRERLMQLIEEGPKNMLNKTNGTVVRAKEALIFSDPTDRLDDGFVDLLGGL